MFRSLVVPSIAVVSLIITSCDKNPFIIPGGYDNVITDYDQYNQLFLERAGGGQKSVNLTRKNNSFSVKVKSYAFEDTNANFSINNAPEDQSLFNVLDSIFKGKFTLTVEKEVQLTDSSSEKPRRRTCTGTWLFVSVVDRNGKFTSINNGDILLKIRALENFVTEKMNASLYQK